MSLKITQFLGNYSCHVGNAARSYSVLYSLWEAVWLVTLMASLIRRTKCYKRLILFMKQNFSSLVNICFILVAGKPSTLVALWNRPRWFLCFATVNKKILVKYKLNKLYQELFFVGIEFLNNRWSEWDRAAFERKRVWRIFLFCMLPTASNPEPISMSIMLKLLF